MPREVSVLIQSLEISFDHTKYRHSFISSLLTLWTGLHITEITEVISSNSIDVAVLVETWLHGGIHDDSIRILGYSAFTKDRSNGHSGGGILIYTRDGVPCQALPQLDNADFEVLWLLHRRPLMPREVSFCQPSQSQIITLSCLLLATVPKGLNNRELRFIAESLILVGRLCCAIISCTWTGLLYFFSTRLYIHD